MKTLILMRHAKADPHGKEGGDHARKLTPRGLKDSRAMAAEIAARGLTPDLVLCSDARRATETMDAVLPSLGQSVTRIIDPGLYLVGADAILARLRRIESYYSTVLVIGHNPGFENFAAAMLAPEARAKKSDDAERLREKFPTAAIAVIETDIETWADLDYRTGRLVAFLAPRDLADG